MLIQEENKMCKIDQKIKCADTPLQEYQVRSTEAPQWCRSKKRFKLTIFSKIFRLVKLMTMKSYVETELLVSMSIVYSVLSFFTSSIKRAKILMAKARRPDVCSIQYS